MVCVRKLRDGVANTTKKVIRVSKNAIVDHAQRVKDPGLSSKLTVASAFFVAADLPFFACAALTARVLYQRKEDHKPTGILIEEQEELPKDVAARCIANCISALKRMEEMEKMEKEIAESCATLSSFESTSENDLALSDDEAASSVDADTSMYDEPLVYVSDDSLGGSTFSLQPPEMRERLDSAREMDMLIVSKVKGDNAALMHSISANKDGKADLCKSTGDKSEDSAGWVDLGADEFN